MHAWDALTPIEETLRFLDDAISSGKIAYYGFSNYLGWHITKAVHVAKAHNFAPPVTLQPQYNLLVRDIEHEVDARLPGRRHRASCPGRRSAAAGSPASTSATKCRPAPPASARTPSAACEAYEARNASERTWRIIDAVAAIGEGARRQPGRGRRSPGSAPGRR